MPTDFVDGVLAGMLYHFPNAVDPELSDRRPTTDQESIKLRIAGATFRDRYTERLSGTDLRKAIYVYATADTVVGRLAEPEVRFLKDNGAAVIPGDGANHLTLALDQAILDRIHDATAATTLTRPRPSPVRAPGTHREPREPWCKTGCPICTNLRH